MTKDVDNPPFRDPSGIAYICDPSRPVLAHGRPLPEGTAIVPHDHPRGQFLWAVRGVLRVISGASVWIVPASHGVWIPGGTPHHVVSETESETRNLYVDPSRPLRRDAQGCTVLLLTPLMRELTLRLTATPDPDNPIWRRLSDVALDEIEALAEAPLSLPGGHDPRLVRVIRHFQQHPAEPRGLEALAELAGTSPRTLERLFRSETGIPFRQWRTRLRLLLAIERLSQGDSSTAIAYSLGYRSPSAFVAAFHQQFGCPPQRYLQE